MNTAPKLHALMVECQRRAKVNNYSYVNLSEAYEWMAKELQAIAALAPPSGEGADAFRVMRSAFVTSESCGPDGDYRLVFRFRSLEALQQAHREWVTTPHSAPVDEVIRYEPLSPTSNTMMRVVDTVSPDWAKRGEHPTDWINELGTLGQHPNAMPHWVRTAIKTIYHGLTPTPPQASQERERVLELFLGRIFAAQRKNEAGEYIGWKISGFGSLNEVVAEAREYLNCPLSPPSSAAAAKEPEQRCPYCAGLIYSAAGCQNCKVGSVWPKPIAAEQDSSAAEDVPDFWVREDSLAAMAEDYVCNAAEQAKPVAINPVEIDSKLIPDAAEQAKPALASQLY